MSYLPVKILTGPAATVESPTRRLEVDWLPLLASEIIMFVAHLNVGLLFAIALLIIFLLGLSAFQNWTVRKHHAGSIFVSKAAPIARWLLGLLIVAYILFIAFRLQDQFTSAMR